MCVDQIASCILWNVQNPPVYHTEYLVMCCVSNCGLWFGSVACVQCRSTLPTSLPKAWQERRLHHAVIEGLSDAVVIPQGLVV